MASFRRRACPPTMSTPGCGKACFGPMRWATLLSGLGEAWWGLGACWGGFLALAVQSTCARSPAHFIRTTLCALRTPAPPAYGLRACTAPCKALCASPLHPRPPQDKDGLLSVSEFFTWLFTEAAALLPLKWNGARSDGKGGAQRGREACSGGWNELGDWLVPCVRLLHSERVKQTAPSGGCCRGP